MAGGLLAWAPVAAWFRAEPTQDVPATGRVRVVTFNAFRANPSPTAAARGLIALDADVLLIQEAGGLGDGLQLLEARYPYHGICRPGCDLAIFSRVPTDRPRWKFRTADSEPLGAPLVQAMVRPPGQRPFTVVSVHLARPYRNPTAARAEIADLARTVRARAGAGAILAGDFNRPAWSSQIAGFERATGMRRAPSFAPTWPANDTLPALVPIDHVFAGPEWLFGRSRVVTLPGSDHRAMVVDLVRITPPEPAAPSGPVAAPAPVPSR